MLGRTPRPGPNRRFAGVALALACSAAVALPASVAAAGSNVARPDFGGPFAVTLSGGAVSCLNAKLCFAVGISDTARPFTAQWNGHAWSKKAAPGGATVDFSGVSCGSTTSCFAVGAKGKVQKTLIEHWNGKAWSVVASPNPSGTQSGALTSVSCVNAKACFAVGSAFNGASQRTLVEHWDGAHWTIQKSPNTSSDAGTESWLNSVSCTSATNCFAVGSTENSSVDDAFIESWNGSSWSISARQNPNGELNWLLGVSCVSASRCVSVGEVNTAEPALGLEDVWNGTAWTLSQTPPSTNDVIFSSVSCVSANNCLAVGSRDFETGLAERFNGTKWSLVAGPLSPGAVAVSCISPSSCYAVGQTTVQHWNGSRWSIVAGA